MKMKKKIKNKITVLAENENGRNHQK